MKTTIKLVALIITSGVLFACGASNTESSKEEIAVPVEEIDYTTYQVYGDTISTASVLSPEEMLVKYQAMEEGDSIQLTFRANVKEVCQKKGCWMKVSLKDSTSTAMVRFKDYKFFVPKDVDSSQSIVGGWAYKEMVSVEKLQHYAKDAGKSEEVIAAIIEPEVKYTFVADGVMLKQN